MVQNCIALVFFLVPAALSGSYADQLLDQLAQEVTTDDPVTQLLVTERLYYLAHETGRQERVTELLAGLFERAEHQELRAEIGYFLAQHYRQLSRYEEAAGLIRELGYVSQWHVLGPLAPGDVEDLKPLLSQRSLKGLDRDISPVFVPAYGDDDFWSKGMGHYGFFNTNNVVYPNQLAGALLTTWFQLEENQTVRLGLGWANRAKVWINRTQIMDTEANQSAHPDQAVLAFALKKGWHRLSVYVESEGDKPDLGLYARLTNPSGEPITTRARATRKQGRKKPSLLPPLEQSLAALARARTPYDLASVILLKEQARLNEDEAPKDLLVKALQANPNRQVADKLFTLTENANERWQILTGLLEQLPESAGLDRAWANAQLGQIALGQKRFWEARKYAAQALEADPGYWPAQIVENNTLSALNLEGQALHNTLALSRRFPGVPWLMMDLSDLYWELDYRVEARRQTEAVLAVRAANSKFAERRIKTLNRAGDLEALDTYYRKLLRDSPFSMGTMLSYAKFLLANRRTETAEQLLLGYLEILPENPFLLETLGELKLRQNRQNEALPFLEKALALRPQNPDLEKLIAFSKQGEGSFYEPYRIADTPAVEVLEVSSIVVNIDNTVVKVSPTGQSSTYHQLEWQIMDEPGTSELPGYSFSYAPLRQEAEVTRAEILRRGEIIHMTQFGRARISDPAYRMYYDLVAYQVAFPPLEVGDIIRVEYRIDDTGNTNIFGDYFGDLRYFTGRYPTRQVNYTLMVPSERTIHYHVEKMKPDFEQFADGDNQVYRWQLQKVSPFETERRMPGLAGYMPYVAVSTFNDWQNMASWYANLIEDQLVLDSETRAIVKKLTDGVSDRMEIVKKIHEYVISNTRYVALEFGIHGYKPYQVNQVCSRQFGDCKDKASLIVSMLRQAGVEAQVAIVRTVDKGYVHTFPAMLAYFNHAIAYVPEFDLYLDGTAEFSGINELPAMDQGALTLLVDKDGVGKLTKIPISDDNRQDYDLAFSLSPDGSADVSGSLHYNGVATPRLREYLSIETKLAQNLQNLMKETLPGLDVLKANREGRSINEPITLRFTGRTNQLLQKSNGNLSLSLSILGDALTQDYAANANRQFPIDVGVPKSRSVALTIESPDGYTFDTLPESLMIEDKNLRVQLEVVRDNANVCRVNYEVTFKTPRVEPDDYPKLRKLMQEHDRVLEQVIQFVAQ